MANCSECGLPLPASGRHCGIEHCVDCGAVGGYASDECTCLNGGDLWCSICGEYTDHEDSDHCGTCGNYPCDCGDEEETWWCSICEEYTDHEDYEHCGTCGNYPCDCGDEEETWWCSICNEYTDHDSSDHCEDCGNYPCDCGGDGGEPIPIEITYHYEDGLGNDLFNTVSVNEGESFELLEIEDSTVDVPVTVTYKDGDTVHETRKYEVSNQFTLIYWEDENGHLYEPGESVRFYKDTTLTAHFDRNSGGIEITLASPPTKNGYIFNGWSHTKNSASGYKDTVDIYENETFYATWKYEVSYNANGGSGAPSAQEKIHNTALTLSTTKPKRDSANTGSYTITLDANGGSCSKALVSAARTTNYSFKRWQATDGTFYLPGETYTDNAPTTMSAQWSSSTTTASVNLPSASKSNGSASRTVTLNANGGSCRPTSLTSTATITYTHTGWYTAPSGGTKRDSNYKPSKSETLYAQFSSSTGLYSAVTLPTPTRDNHAFKGWATTSSATTGVTGSYTPAGNVTLYAVWEEAATYTVTYDANGGTGAPGPQTAYVGESITIPSKTPTKEVSGTYTITYDANGGGITPNKESVRFTTEYAFCDWNTEKDGGGDPYEPENTYSFEEDITLYAYFEEVITYASSVTLPTLTRSGYNFLGWATSPDAESGITGRYQPDGNVTLYAIWSQPITYQIKYNANGGVGTMENSTHTYGVSSNLSENQFTKSGYEFIGWSTTSTGIVQFTDKQVIINLSYADNSTINLYAVWKSLAVIDVKVAGKFKPGVPYVRVGNSWKKGIGAYVKVSGSWKSSS